MMSGALTICGRLAASAAILLSSNMAAAQDLPAASTAQPSTGTTIRMAPLRIEMDVADRAKTLRVFNPSERAIGVQVRAFGWKQELGKDLYFASNDVTVSPSIITIKPGDTQIFRVLSWNKRAEGERRYRIAVDQLPDPELLRGGEAQARIRFTIPMFIGRATARPSSVSWSLRDDRLIVTNSGGQTVRMVNLRLKNAEGEPIPVKAGGLSYIQGGSTLSWLMPDGCATGLINVSASIDRQAVNVQVPNTCR